MSYFIKIDHFLNCYPFPTVSQFGFHCFISQLFEMIYFHQFKVSFIFPPSLFKFKVCFLDSNTITKNINYQGNLRINEPNNRIQKSHQQKILEYCQTLKNRTSFTSAFRQVCYSVSHFKFPNVLKFIPIRIPFLRTVSYCCQKSTLRYVLFRFMLQNVVFSRTLTINVTLMSNSRCRMENHFSLFLISIKKEEDRCCSVFVSISADLLPTYSNSSKWPNECLAQLKLFSESFAGFFLFYVGMFIN